MSKKPSFKQSLGRDIHRRGASIYAAEKKYKKTPPICQSVEQYIPDIVVVVPFFRSWFTSLNIFQCLSNEGNLRYFPWSNLVGSRQSSFFNVCSLYCTSWRFCIFALRCRILCFFVSLLRFKFSHEAEKNTKHFQIELAPREKSLTKLP